MGRIHPQPIAQAGDIRKARDQKIRRDDNLRAGIAVVGIDPGHRQRAAGQVDQIAQAQAIAAVKLFVDQSRLPSGQPVPRIGSGQQHRPIVAIGGVIGHAVNFGRLAGNCGFGRPNGQDGRGARGQPIDHLRRLIGRAGCDVKLGRQPLIQPAREGLAKAANHCADADIRSQGQHQGHQRKREARKLLASVGPKPLGQHAARHAAGGKGQGIQEHRQNQGRTQQQRRQEAKPGPKPHPQKSKATGQRQKRKPGPGLPAQTPHRFTRPSARLGRGQ